MRCFGRQHGLSRCGSNVHRIGLGHLALLDRRWLVGRGRGIVPGVRLAGCMVIFLAGVHQPLVAHQKVTAGKTLGADVAHERFLFGVGADVSLEMFLSRDSLSVEGRGIRLASDTKSAPGLHVQAGRTVAGNADKGAS